MIFDSPSTRSIVVNVGSVASSAIAVAQIKSEPATPVSSDSLVAIRSR